MIIPYILGRMIAPRHTHALPLVVLWGYVVLWGIFEVIAVPCIYNGASLQTLITIYFTATACIVLGAVFLFRKKILFDCASWSRFFKEGEFRRIALFAVVNIAMILAQAAFVFKFMHEDADDAEYVAMANDSWERGSLLVTNPYTGFMWEDADIKRYISPFSLWIAVIAKVVRVAPATIAHAHLPVLIILLGYAAVFAALVAVFRTLRADTHAAAASIGDSKTRSVEGHSAFSGTNPLAPWIGLFIFNLLVIFGGTTTRSYGSMVLLRPWQGKAVLCAVILPLLFSELLEWGAKDGKKAGFIPSQQRDDTDGKKREMQEADSRVADKSGAVLQGDGDVERWYNHAIRLIFLALAALLLTGMSIPMVPLLVGAFGVVYVCDWILRKFH